MQNSHEGLEAQLLRIFCLRFGAGFIRIPKVHAVPPQIPLDRELDFMYSVSNTEDIIHVHREKQNTTHIKQP